MFSGGIGNRRMVNSRTDKRIYEGSVWEVVPKKFDLLTKKKKEAWMLDKQGKW